MITPVLFGFDNKKVFVVLTAEKLSGFGIYICKSAAKILAGYGQGFGCIFIKRKNISAYFIHNNKISPLSNCLRSTVILYG